MTPRRKKPAKPERHEHSPGFGVTDKFPAELAPNGEQLVEDEGEQLVDEADENADPDGDEQNVAPTGEQLAEQRGDYL